MTRTEFDEWRRRRNLWELLLYTSEGALLLIAALWGVQLVYVGHLSIAAGEPISRSLLSLAPWMPIRCHGYGLICLSVFHIWALWREHHGGRRWCIVAQMLFFAFVWWSLLLARQVVPFVWVFPVFLVGCVVNYLALVRPKTTG